MELAHIISLTAFNASAAKPRIEIDEDQLIQIAQALSLLEFALIKRKQHQTLPISMYTASCSASLKHGDSEYFL